MPRYFLSSILATNAVVPEPIKGSHTIPFVGQLAFIGISRREVGNRAKCNSLEGSVPMSHTLGRFFPLGLFIRLWSLPVGVIEVPLIPLSLLISRSLV